MPTRKNEAAELAQRLVGVLQKQRSLGSYPVSLETLLELAGSNSRDLVTQGSRNKAFTQQAIVALKENPASPVALIEDRDALAGNPRLLEAMLETVCTPESPACPLNKLRTKVHSQLKQPFELAIKSQVANNTLPPGVGSFTRGTTIHLFLHRYGKPKKPEESLAEKLVVALRSAREAGESYPITWQRLIETVDSNASATLVAKAGKQPICKDNIFAIGTKLSPQTPVALAEDADKLVGHPAVLEFAIRASRTASNHVFAIAALKNKLTTRLRTSFVAACSHVIEAGALPACAGFLLSKNKPLLFLVDDLRLRNGPETSAKPQAAASRSSFDFAPAFDEAFTRLDRQGGSLNFVSLVGLRRAIPLDREQFDLELRRLRLAGRYGLSAAEGRHGISPDEQAAGIIEEGSLLLFVSRKSP
jgi:hypothetical protein